MVLLPFLPIKQECGSKAPTLAGDGFLRFSPDEMHAMLRGPTVRDWSEDFEELRKSHEGLETDEFMMDRGSYRRRRFGRMELDSETLAIKALPAGSFFQAENINQLNGGIQRVFAPIGGAEMRNPVLHALIRALFEWIPEKGCFAKWEITLHQVRIIARGSEAGKPTPEGIHQDGHHYVGMVMMDRKNVIGGVSRIYDLNKNLTSSLTLKKPLEALLVRDTVVFHEVTPVELAPGADTGFRDMLLIDYNPVLSEAVRK